MSYKVLNKKRNIFYQILFFTGLILIIWEIFIFRKTIISSSFLLAIILGIGFFATFLDFKDYKTTYGLKGWKLYFFTFMQNTVSWGFIFCSLLVLSNYYFSTTEIIEKKYEIVERSSMPGSKEDRSKWKPLVQINYEGKMKELVFSHLYYGELNEYKFVTISTKKGFIYWDIIVNQELKK